MLQSIEIENFRCFEKTAISGFEQINLITGKNNAGKTALLEAIFYFLSSQRYAIIKNARKSSNEADNVKSIYFNQRTTIPISLSGYWDNERSLFSIKDVNAAYSPPAFTKDFELAFIVDKDSQIPVMEDIAAFFDDEVIAGNSRIIHDSLAVIDDTLEEIRTFGSRQGVLYLRKKGEENYVSINFYGDATQKIVRYVVNILSLAKSGKKFKLLLIDEIENGIHYIAQAEVWRMLMRLCKHFNIQLFATTHSLEMIKAFQQVCSEEELIGMGGYFELGRSPKNGQIIGVKHDLETLEYELASGDTIRGE
ncbi:AAA family ATPase [Runella zeae]|uniref:AAA family ATPase n=1 Tax=Runella zeae TaxID=94255 RepID=UPI00042159CF|nr:AAA family ATPase [Runella zeae]